MMAMLRGGGGDGYCMFYFGVRIVFYIRGPSNNTIDLQTKLSHAHYYSLFLSKHFSHLKLTVPCYPPAIENFVRVFCFFVWLPNTFLT